LPSDEWRAHASIHGTSLRCPTRLNFLAHLLGNPEHQSDLNRSSSIQVDQKDETVA
jgi:hypothetical protein